MSHDLTHDKTELFVKLNLLIFLLPISLHTGFIKSNNILNHFYLITKTVFLEFCTYTCLSKLNFSQSLIGTAMFCHLFHEVFLKKKNQLLRTSLILFIIFNFMK